MSSGLNIGMKTAEATRRLMDSRPEVTLYCFLSSSGPTRRVDWFNWGSSTCRSYIRSVPIKESSVSWFATILRRWQMTNIWWRVWTFGSEWCRNAWLRARAFLFLRSNGDPRC